MRALLYFTIGLALQFVVWLPAYADTTIVSVTTSFTPTSYQSCEGWQEDNILKTKCFNWKTGEWREGPTATVGSYWTLVSTDASYNGANWVVNFHLTDAPQSNNNGVKDGDEDGIDCGGSTGVECVDYCPSGMEVFSWDFGGTSCGYFVDQHNGTCPVGYMKSPDGRCLEIVTVTEVTKASPDFNPEIEDVRRANDNPWNEYNSSNTTNIETTTTTNSDGSVTETETVTVTELALDGTQTDKVTTTTTTTNPDGTSTVTTNTTTTTVNPSTGVASSSTESTTSNYDANGNLTDSTTSSSVDGTSDGAATGEAEPGNGLGADVDGDGKGDGVDRQGVSSLDFTPIKDSASNLMMRFPFSVVTRVEMALDSWIVTPQSPQLEFYLPIVRSSPFVMDMSMLDPLASFLRACLAFAAAMAGAYVIIKTWC